MINVVGAAQDVAPLQPEVHSAVVSPTLAAPELPTSPAPLNKKSPNPRRFRMIIGGSLLVLLIIGGVIASYLVRTSQDVRQQASGGSTYADCDTTGECARGYYCNRNVTPKRCTPLPTATPRPNTSSSPTPIRTPSPIKTPTPVVTRIPTLPPISPTGASNRILISPTPGQQILTPTITALGDVIDPTTAPTNGATPEPTSSIGATSAPTTGASDNNEDDSSSVLALAPTPSPTLVQTTASCNESCTSDTNCRNPSHICLEGVCRLESNPDDTSCRLPSGGNQIALNPTQASREYTPEAEPSGTTPVSGPEDWLRYLQVGAGALGLGALLLLFL